MLQVAADRRKQAELEDRILALLSSASGSLLDNVELINTLDDSKVTWQEVNESLKVRGSSACLCGARMHYFCTCSEAGCR